MERGHGKGKDYNDRGTNDGGMFTRSMIVIGSDGGDA